MVEYQYDYEKIGKSNKSFSHAGYLNNVVNSFLSSSVVNNKEKDEILSEVIKNFQNDLDRAIVTMGLSNSLNNGNFGYSNNNRNIISLDIYKENQNNKGSDGMRDKYIDKIKEIYTYSEYLVVFITSIVLIVSVFGLWGMSTLGGILSSIPCLATLFYLEKSKKLMQDKTI